MFEWLLGRKKPEKKVRATYDTARKTIENIRHWQWTDSMDADGSMQTSTRQEVRDQARYEAQQNNSYAYGICRDFVRDVVGTGPRLQMEHTSERVNFQVEKAFSRWALVTGLASKLTTLRLSRLIDGEAVCRFINNRQEDDPVSLGLQLIECDQLASPQLSQVITKDYVDGVHLDNFGEPYAYDILDYHPGNQFWAGVDTYAYKTYSLRHIIHTFREERPGQHRGVSEIVTALPLFAFLRRFTLATISAAETAANVSQVVETDAPIPEELETEYSVNTFEKFMEAIPVDRNSATVLPNQWKLKQFMAEHPTTTYRMFKREVIAEIARCLGMAGVIATADASEHNFASARMDRLGYQKVIGADQRFYEQQVVNKIFAEWLLEASLIGEVPLRLANEVINLYDSLGAKGVAARVPHSWMWDGFEEVDQKQAADAEKIKLSSGTLSRDRAYSKQGLDIDVEDEKAAKSFGLTVDEYRKAIATSIFTNGNILGDNNAKPQTETAQSE